MLALIEKDSNEFIGQCGLLTQEVHGKMEIEVGYSLLRKHWGMGYASESAIFIKKWAFENVNIDSIISIIKMDNEASKTVALKNGMYPDVDLNWKDIEVTIFRISNPNFDL
jgi:[ribosomal protein S5]-alanine N-acetyltransferase